MLALAVALFDTPVKNIYWRLGAETDLKNVFTFHVSAWHMQLKLLHPATEFPKVRSAFKLWFILFF